jgi:hypothetical protein
LRRAPRPFLLVLALSTPAGAADEPLGPEDLEARRAALETWTFEPVALDGGSFLFHMDRRDSSFFILERRTGVKWFSSWGRRGFASVLVAAGEGEETWLPVDSVKSIVASGRSLRLSCASSAGELPGLRIEVKLLEGPGGISIASELDAGSRARVKAIRLLDGALWTTDAGEGGTLLPRGPGEWLPAGEPGDERIVLDGAGGGSPFSVNGLGISSGKSAILVRWTDPSTTLVVERKRVESDAFPGRRGTFHAVEIPIRPGDGPALSRVDLHPLGLSEMGISDAARAVREIEVPDYRGTLRHRTAAQPELAVFASAAVFRPALGEGLGLEAVAGLAERLRKDLGIEDAAMILSGWNEDEREGLSACARRIREAGWVFGLEVKAAPGEAGAEDLSELRDIASPGILLLDIPPLPGDPSKLAEALEARSALGTRAAEISGLVGVKGRSGLDARHSALIEGALEPWSKPPLPARAWPFLPAAVGPAARLTVAAGSGLRSGDDAVFLAHLLAGETPLYAIPGAGDGGGIFARDEGWCAGKGFSADERFIKNTYEASVHAARLRVRNPLIFHRKLEGPADARESFFGMDMRVLVNFGPGNHEDADDGVVLPPGGFLIKHPNLLAFHALRANGVAYDRPAFFVVRSLEGKMYLRAERVSIYRGFGPGRIDLGGKTFEVDRESIVKVW